MTDLHKLPEWEAWERLMDKSFDRERNLPQFLRAPRGYAGALITKLAELLKEAEGRADRNWELHDEAMCALGKMTELREKAEAENERAERLAADLAERDEALVVAWRLCLQEAWQDLRVHLNNERREG